MGIGFETKSKSKNVRVDWTAVIIQLTKVYTIQKEKKKKKKKKKKIELYRKRPSSTNLLNSPRILQRLSLHN